MIYKVLISALAFLILTFFAYKWHDRNFCCPAIETSKKEILKVEKSGPIVFKWGNGEAIANDLWPTKKRSILEKKSGGELLHIIGEYYADEVNTTSYENLGIARAESAKRLMVDEISAADLFTGSRLLAGTSTDTTKDLELLSFSWQVKPEEITEKEEPAALEENENVVVLDDEILLRFPYKSTEKLDNKNINDYLVKLAAELIKNDKRVDLVGHTDNVGRNAYNERLGMERSKAIKSILVDMGVSSDRISATSKGETEPIESNDTEVGQQANRRVSVKVK